MAAGEIQVEWACRELGNSCQSGNASQQYWQAIFCSSVKQWFWVLTLHTEYTYKCTYHPALTSISVKILLYRVLLATITLPRNLPVDDSKVFRHLFQDILVAKVLSRLISPTVWRSRTHKPSSEESLNAWSTENHVCYRDLENSGCNRTLFPGVGYSVWSLFFVLFNPCISVSPQFYDGLFFQTTD